MTAVLGCGKIFPGSEFTNGAHLTACLIWLSVPLPSSPSLFLTPASSPVSSLAPVLVACWAPLWPPRSRSVVRMMASSSHDPEFSHPLPASDSGRFLPPDPPSSQVSSLPQLRSTATFLLRHLLLLYQPPSHFGPQLLPSAPRPGPAATSKSPPLLRPRGS